jgi:hypothetical protein
MKRMAEDPAAAARRTARAEAQVRILRQGDPEALEVHTSALDWDQIPVEDRPEFVWQLSVELHRLSNPEAPYEPRLSRSIARVFRS